MPTQLIIEINDEKALGFLRELENLDWIHVKDSEQKIAKAEKLSERIRGKLSKEAAEDLATYVKKSREEWERF